MYTWLQRLLVKSFLPIILVVCYVGFGLMEPNFRTFSNFLNILQQASYLTMLAAAQMVLLITRGFDLSVGTVIGMISVASSLVMVSVLKGDPAAFHSAVWWAWVVGLSLGFGVGAVNGFCVAYLGLSPFMVTLGMMGIGLGFASTISGGFPVFDVPAAYVDLLSRASLFGLPVAVAVCIIVLGIVYFLLKFTVFGRCLYLIGSNPWGAFVAGLSTRFNLAWAYVVCSLIVAVVALMLTARTGSGEPRLGLSLMFESLMAAIIGGVALSGGEGHVLHCILGGLFVTILSNGMNMLRMDANIQLMILGAILIATIFIDRLRAHIR